MKRSPAGKLPLYAFTAAIHLVIQLYRDVPNLRISSLLRSAKTLRSYDTISSTLLVTRPVQSSTGTCTVPVP